MAKKRPNIPKNIKEAVLKEYRHKCAICGHSEPHIHHIDEDSSNNDKNNLLPLCPNCHIQDTHDPTSSPEPRKLQLFRKYKDPLILDARFHPIYKRTEFLYSEEIRENKRLYSYYANELLEFIEQFEMGSFYRKKILGYLKNVYSRYTKKLKDEGADVDNKDVINSEELKSDAHKYCAESIEELLVEMLRYQGWVAAPFNKK